MTEKQKNIFIILVVLLLLAGGFYYYKNTHSQNGDQNATSTSETATTTLSGDDILSILQKNNPGLKIEKVDTTQNTLPPAPNLDKPIVFGNNISDEIKQLLSRKLAEITTALKSDSSNFANWIDLGVSRKMAGDYAGAAEAWEYASLLSPDNTLSFDNLGDLYHYDLKEYTKSEQNFLTVISNDPTNQRAYLGLHELYKYSYKTDTNKAVEILEQGLKKLPTDTDLMIALATYYKEKNNVEKAIEYYQKASDTAKSLGNTQLYSELQKEISSLK